MTTMEPKKTSVDPSQIQRVLEEIGYKLIDFGNHWRTNAVYRGGDNPTAIQIYKNSGVWTDFSVGNKANPFELLLQLSLQNNQEKLREIKKTLNKSSDYVYIKKETIEMDEVYPEEILQKLFPNYNFYTKKGFSEDTLKAYKSGLAGAGKMYRRMVFPIYNEHRQIIGFSGRKIEDGNDKIPKWKHLGKKKNWVYPAFVDKDNSVDSIIKERKRVVLVESIGDSLALFESGIQENLVTFGIGISPALISYLNSFPIEKITIAGNNDLEAEKNHGLIGSLKILMALRQYFDFDVLEIKMPPNKHNDLSKAFEAGEDLRNWYNKKLDRARFLSKVKDYVTTNSSSFKQKDVESLLKTIANYEQA